MKIVFAILLLSVAANALPYIVVPEPFVTRELRVVTNNIRAAILKLAQRIKDSGLDPFQIERFEETISPVPIYFTITGLVEQFKFKGLGNIAINNLDYSVILNRLRLDLSLPNLSASIGNAEVGVNAFGTRYDGQLTGNLEVIQIRVAGEVRVNIGIFSGVSLRSVDLTFRVENIQSAFNVIYQGQDLSAEVNNVFNDEIPAYLVTNQNKIDQRLSERVLEIGNQVLGNSLIVDY